MRPLKIESTWRSRAIWRRSWLRAWARAEAAGPTTSSPSTGARAAAISEARPAAIVACGSSLVSNSSTAMDRIGAWAAPLRHNSPAHTMAKVATIAAAIHQSRLSLVSLAGALGGALSACFDIKSR